MKKIINGKRYDTETAEEVGFADNGYYPNDFYYCEESLYRKKTGEFFLYGYGGAMSKYACRAGKQSGSSAHIEPLSYKQAQKWAEKNLDEDEYEEIFGEIEDDGDFETMTLVISSVNAAKIRRIASQKSIKFGEVIDLLIKNYESHEVQDSL